MSLTYHVYANTGVGDPIDYSTVVATTPSLTWTSGALRTRHLAVRRSSLPNVEFARGRESRLLDHARSRRLERNDITNRPVGPVRPSRLCDRGRRHPGRVGLQHHKPVADPDRLPCLPGNRRDAELLDHRRDRPVHVRDRRHVRRESDGRRQRNHLHDRRAGPITRPPRKPTQTPSTSPPCRSGRRRSSISPRPPSFEGQPCPPIPSTRSAVRSSPP